VEGRLVKEVAAELDLTEAAAFRRSHRLKEKIEKIAAEVLGGEALDVGGPALVVLLASVLAQGMLA
jgi:hypothetical protein